MASQNFLLEPCLPTDIEEMIRVYHAAFKNDYLGSFVFPLTIEPAERHCWAHARFLATFSKPEVSP